MVKQIDGQIGIAVEADWRALLAIRRNGGHHQMLSVLDHGATHGMRVGPDRGQHWDIRHVPLPAAKAREG